MRLSIIIPVYNVEETLRRCVESVTSTKMNDYEIILVDDGSTDGSSALCDKLAKENKRIKAFHQQNGGLSAARNTGLKRAHGEYVTFLDSDDFVEEGTYPLLMSILRAHTEYDILEYPVVVAYGSKYQHRFVPGKKEFTKMKDYWLKGCVYNHAYACNKIFRKELFNGVRFPEGWVFEDVWTLPRVLSNAKVAATTAQGLYYYCHNDRGITATAGQEELNDLLVAHQTYIEEYTKEADWSSREFAIYYAHVLNIMLDVYKGRSVSIGKTSQNIRKNILAVTPKLFIMKHFGFKTLSTINSIWHTIVPRKHF